MQQGRREGKGRPFGLLFCSPSGIVVHLFEGLESLEITEEACLSSAEVNVD